MLKTVVFCLVLPVPKFGKMRIVETTLELFKTYFNKVCISAYILKDFSIFDC